VVATNAAGDTLTLSNVTVESGTGSGVDVTGGTLSANGTNAITTTTGVGLRIVDATIGGGGSSFNTVDVNVLDVAGATNAVVLDNLTGGQVTVGNAATASTMNTDGDTILVTNVANANLNNIDVSSAARGLVATNDDANAFDLSVNDLTVDNTGTQAVAASHTGGGDLTFDVTNSDFDNIVDINANGTGDVNHTFNDTVVDTTGADVAYTLSLDTNVTNAVVQVRRSNFTADTATAFNFDSTSAGVKNVTFELSNSMTTNLSAGASAEIDAFGATVLGATINENTFTNAGAGNNFDLAANDGTTVVNLSMDLNTTVGGTASVVLRELNAADFNIVNRDTLITRNPGVGNFIFDSAGNVIGDFDDIPALP